MLLSMLENMHMALGGTGTGNGRGQSDKARDEAIQKLGDMMGKQRSLLDKTMRQQQGSGDPKDGGTQGLAKQQGELQKELNGAMGSMDPKLRQQLQDAQRAMENAGKALGAKDMD